MDGTGGQQSVAFLTQLKEKHPGPLRVAPAHRGEAVREYLRTPELELRLVNLPGYSPDFNADEAVWGWAREEVTGNLCLGSRAAVQACRQIPGRAGQPERRGETALHGRSWHSRETPAPIPSTRQMHIPPWLWFSWQRPCAAGASIVPLGAAQ